MANKPKNETAPLQEEIIALASLDLPQRGELSELLEIVKATWTMSKRASITPQRLVRRPKSCRDQVLRRGHQKPDQPGAVGRRAPRPPLYF